MTEYNLDRDPPTIAPPQQQRFQAKVVLRYLLAFINKGLGMVDFYAARRAAWACFPTASIRDRQGPPSEPRTDA